MSALGGKLKALRKAAHLSLSEVAARAGVTKAHLWELEAGRATNPGVKTLYRIAVAYKADPLSLAAFAFGDCKKSIKTKAATIVSVCN